MNILMSFACVLRYCCTNTVVETFLEIIIIMFC